MEERSISRIKSAMVVYEFERALGRFVRDRSADVASSPTAIEILKRSTSTIEQTTVDVARQIVENSYLGEILSLALTAAKGSSDAAHLIELEKLCTALGLFDIRNAISTRIDFFQNVTGIDVQRLQPIPQSINWALFRLHWHSRMRSTENLKNHLKTGCIKNGGQFQRYCQPSQSIQSQGY